MPKVSIVVTTWLEQTKPYLDMCIKSIANLNYAGEIETIIVGRKSYQPQYPNVKTIAPDSDDFANPAGINFGFKNASKDSKHFLYLNDDACLTKNSLTNLVQAAGDNMGVFNPICHDNQNCYWLHYPCPRPSLKELETFNTFLDVDSVYPEGLFSLPWICMFSTLIPRKVWEVVGDWDEGFLTGADDIDWTWRALEKGIGLFGVLNSFVYHGGGKSADITMDSEKRRKVKEYFVRKWGRNPP